MTPREPDRFEAIAAEDRVEELYQDTLRRLGERRWPGTVPLVAMVKAAESEALERAAQTYDQESESLEADARKLDADGQGMAAAAHFHDARVAEANAKRIRALKDPAAAPAAETDRCACGAENLLGVTSIRSADGKTHMRDSCAAGSHRIAPLQDVDPEGTWGARYLHELQGKQRAIPAPAQGTEAPSCHGCETKMHRIAELNAILRRALYEEGYCEITTAGELAAAPKGHAAGCYAGVNTGCNCWVGRARFLAPQSGEGK